ncbi:MAG: glycosyltransferase, partial [Nitrososphaerales archaeon]
YNVVLSLGYPSGSTTPRKITNGVWLYEWCPVKDELFQLSSLMVARAGHGTIGQCINQGTPAVLIPIFNHSEQLANAEKYQRLGLGIALRAEILSKKSFVASVSHCLENPDYKERSQFLQGISRRYDGVDGVVRIVREYL